MGWIQHPSVFISGNTPCLKVFKHLKADPTLPKYLVDGKVVIKNRKPMTVDEYIRGADGMSEYRKSLTSSMKAMDNNVNVASNKAIELQIRLKMHSNEPY